jgi:competence protein ComEC
MQLLAIFRKSPFARLLLFYTAGILSAGLISLQNTLSNYTLTGVVVFLIGALLVTVCRRPGYNTDWLTGLVSGAALFVIGFINMNIQYQAGNRLIKTSGYQGLFVMEIADTPEIKEKSVKATVNIKGYLAEGIWNNDQQKIMVYFEKDTSSVRLMPGDRILAKSKLSGVTAPKNPGEFDYRRYLAVRGIYNQAYLESGLWKTNGNNRRSSIRILAFRMQGQLLRAYQKIGLNNTLYSVLSALTLGYKNDLETHTKQVFSQAGVMHVMALSGFNVAVIALAMGYLLVFSDRYRAGRIFKTMVIILVIWLFAFVTGLSPSVTRAAVMISFVMTGKLIHRQINTYNILFASAFLLMAISPGLIFDISFQLSFAAVMGIIIYQPVIYRLVVFKHTISDKIWEIFAVSCAAQLSTLPLTLYYFHQFPVYFWLTNLYVVPLVSVIICVAGVFLLVSSVEPLMLLTGKVLAILLAALYKAVAFIEILPFSLIESIHISGMQTVVLVAFILFLGLFTLQRKIISLWLALSLFAIFQLMNTMQAISLRNQKVFMVGNLKGHSAINMISGKEGILLADSALSFENPAVRYAFNNFWTEHGVADNLRLISCSDEFLGETEIISGSFYKSTWLGNNIFFEFFGKRIIIIKDNYLYRYGADYPLKVDLVIVTGNLKPDMDALVKLLDPELLILDSSVKNYQAVQWIKLCQRLGVNCWNISQKGAYMLTIK